MVWNNDKVANPELPSPGNYGWNMLNNEWVAAMATDTPASEAVLHLVLRHGAKLCNAVARTLVSTAQTSACAVNRMMRNMAMLIKLEF